MARSIKKLVPIPDYRLFPDELPLCKEIWKLRIEHSMVMSEDLALLRGEMIRALPEDDNISGCDIVDALREYSDVSERWRKAIRSQDQECAVIQCTIDRKLEDLRALHGRDYDVVTANWEMWRSLIQNGDDLSVSVK